jgi:tetratricopeptide (TPR) repeat protein
MASCATGRWPPRSEAAQEVLRARMFESARGFYAQALAREPQNWALMQEIALRLLLPAGEAAAAAEMATAALALNPLSADLWRALAEAELARDDLDAARDAAGRAIALAPQNVEAHLTQARVALARGDHEAALLAIARGLAHDRDTDGREAALALQDRVLTALAEDSLAALRARANAFRALDDPPE